MKSDVRCYSNGNGFGPNLSHSQAVMNLSENDGLDAF